MAEAFPMSRVADVTLPPYGLRPSVRFTITEESVHLVPDVTSCGEFR